MQSSVEGIAMQSYIEGKGSVLCCGPWPKVVLETLAQSSWRDQDLNERPGEAPPQSKLENPGETKQNKTAVQAPTG